MLDKADENITSTLNFRTCVSQPVQDKFFKREELLTIHNSFQVCSRFCVYGKILK